MYKSVFELSRDEIVELKENFMIELADSGNYAEIMGVEWNEPSWGELAAADELVSDEIILYHHAFTLFTDEDFACAQNNERTRIE